MIVLHMESGLGNQMLNYCEYLALKRVNPDEDIYIETLVYEIPEAHEYINQWNGYELDSIFGIKLKNIKELFSASEWETIKKEVIASEFWKKNWNYPKYITEVLNKHGMNLINIRGDFEKSDHIVLTKKNKIKLTQKIKQSGLFGYIRYVYHKIKPLPNRVDINNLFYDTNGDNIFTGQRLTFKYTGNNIDLIDEEIRKAFIFPKLDKKNYEFKKMLESTNSVSIHARRGDMLNVTGRNYKDGYFKRATKYIKRNVKNPTFIFFCDPASSEWVKKNLKTFGLNKNDAIYFVDWNAGTDSYKDMQLMTYCKHNIVTISTFGWWGAYLNNNPDKITISPETFINTNTHF